MFFIAYYRVSTKKQAFSGLGLEAQRAAVSAFVQGRGEILKEYTETESGKKTDKMRPELNKALQQCCLTGATLVIATLDRLARNAHFLLGLKESGVKFVCADMPEANEMTIGILAIVAEEEAKTISTRIKAALAAAKARGVKLGNPKGTGGSFTAEGRATSAAIRKAKADTLAASLVPILADLAAQGITSFSGIARELNARHIKTSQGKKWHPSTVSRLCTQLRSKTALERFSEKPSH